MAEENLIEQIRRRAHEIWLSEGCPHGRDRIHWLRAEAEFREKLGPAQSDTSSNEGFHGKPKDSGSLRGQSPNPKQGAGRKVSKRGPPSF